MADLRVSLFAPGAPLVGSDLMGFRRGVTNVSGTLANVVTFLGTALAIGGLSDVNSVAPSDGDLLIFNSGNYENVNTIDGGPI